MRELEALFNPNRGEAALAVGLKQYEDGRYAESLKNLQTAVGQGLSDGDRVNAHKHVAFIHCAANRERACRDEFRRALRVNPAMELAPAEAGHPIWGPIFRSVKAGR
jgi:Tfp pilus assembly protein PilF